jgi:EmrB/QacA subfamily drug resistance transporter
MVVSRSVVQQSPRGWALALTAIAFFMVSLDLLVVVTALPVIQHDLGAGLTTLEWAVNAYSLASAAGIITAAALADRFGRRRLFTVGLALFTAASAACALAPSAGLLIAARAVQGLGAAMVTPIALTILVSAFPPKRRGAIVGIWGGLAGLAIAGGPLVGGAVTQGLDWHWIFWVNVPIGLVASILARLRLAESYGPATRLDLPAVVLATGGAVGIVWGLVRAADLGWGNPQIIAALTTGVLLLSAFVAWERRAREPMLPLRLFENRTFAAASATAFLTTAALLAAAFMLSQYLQVALGNSPVQAGLRFLPMTATPLLVAPAAGLLADRFGQRPVMLTGLLLFAVGMVWLVVVATPDAGYARLVLPLLLAGVGISMPFATTPTAALSAVAPADMGKASGATNTLQRFGGVFGVAVATAVFTANGHLGTSASFDAGLRPALALAAGLAVLGALSAMAVGTRGRGSTGVPAKPAGARPDAAMAVALRP